MTESLATVLIVDDEADHRTMTRMLLQPEGITVLEAASGAEALEVVEKSKPDLVLLDFHMEGLNGVETLLRLRDFYTSSELPVLMLSGHQEPDTIAYALDSGANDYIDKLTHPKVLLARVRRHLHKISLAVEPLPALGELRLLRCLGENAVCTAFLLNHPSSSEPLVARILKPGFSLNSKSGRLAPPIAHKGVSNLVALSTDPVDYVLAEFRQGPTLEARLQESPLGIPLVKALLIQMLDAVATIHRAGRTHLDLHPANIVVDEAGESFILDLGLAALIVQENEVTASDFCYGNPAFRSPEQKAGASNVDYRSDVYALGALLRFMLEHEEPSSSLEPLRDLAKSMLVPDPAQRKTAIGEISNTLMTL